MAADGEVLYEIRGDDSNLESDLDAAQKKVEQSDKKSAQRREEIEEKTSEAVKDEKKNVTEHHKQENKKQVEDDADSGEKREETAHKTSEKIKSIATGTTKAIGAAMAAVGTAAVAAGTMAVGTAVEMDKAVNQFLTSTGMAEKQTMHWLDGTVEVIDNAKNYQSIMEEIYKDNFGEDFNDIAEAMAEVNKQMTYLDDTQLRNATESAFTLRDVFGYEVPESVRAANSMVDAFGVSADTAFNLIAQGAQYGLDFSGELLDSIDEYAPQFKKLGLSAEDMFQVFASGTNAGAWNLDKIGDAVKELSIRVIDGSDTTAEGFKLLGLNADEMSKKFGQGGDAAREAFQETIAALKSMEDPLAQNTAGVDLFGTMWEDLGADVVTNLTDINDGLDATYDAMGELQKVKYNDLGSMFEGLKRNVELLLLPLGNELIPILSELTEMALPLLEEALPPILDVFGELISQMSPMIEELLPSLLDLINSLAPPLTDMLESVLPVFLDLFQELLPPLVDLIDAVLPVVVALLDALLPMVVQIVEALAPLLEILVDILTPILDLMELAIGPLIEIIGFLIEEEINVLVETLQNLMDVFGLVFETIVKTVQIRFRAVQKIFQDIIEFIKNVFTGNWKAAWENVRNIFKTIAESLAEIFKIPINWIIDKINSFIDGLNKIQIPEWVPVLGGKGFSIPHIPKLRVGMDYVPTDDFPAFLHRGEAVLTAEENAALRSIGGMGVVYSLLNTPEYNPSSSVTVENMSVPESIDYERLGAAVTEALLDGNVRFVIDGREYARLEKEL